MFGVLFCRVFDRKIVNNEGEDCCSRAVFPEAWSVLDWMIAKLVEVFGELHIDDDSRLF